MDVIFLQILLLNSKKDKMRVKYELYCLTNCDIGVI